jgi:hypothetical protein
MTADSEICHCSLDSNPPSQARRLPLHCRSFNTALHVFARKLNLLRKNNGTTLNTIRSATSMYRRQTSDYQISPVDEPSSGIGSRSSNVQPGDGYDGAASLDYETRPDWKLDTPSKYDLNGPMPTPDRPGSFIDRSENHMRSDIQTAADQRLRPEDFAQALTGWQIQQTPEKMPSVEADPTLFDTHNHEFEADAANLNAMNLNARSLAQQDVHMKHNFDGAAFGNDYAGTPYQVPAYTRARWELLKSLVKSRDGPHEHGAGEESNTLAKNVALGSRTRPNQFQGSPPARSSSKSMRTLMLPQIVENRKSVEGLFSDRKAADATHPSQEPLRYHRQGSTAIQQHPSNSTAPEQQQTMAHAPQSHPASHLPAHQSDVPSTDPSEKNSLYTIASASQPISRKSLGDTAVSHAISRPPTDTRTQHPTMPSLQSKAPSSSQQHSRPTPNLGSETAPNPPTKNLTISETAQKQHVQSNPPHLPQKPARAMPSLNSTASQPSPSASKIQTTAHQPTHEIGAVMQSATQVGKISPGVAPQTKAVIVPRQGEQLFHHPQTQSRASFANASLSSAPVQSSGAKRIGSPVPPSQPTNASAAHGGPASPLSRATGNPAAGSPAPVRPNSEGRQPSSALQPTQQPSNTPLAVTTRHKGAQAPSMPTTSQAPATTQHPQRPPFSQAMQPSHTAAQHPLPSQQKPKTAPIVQPPSKSLTAPQAQAPHAPAPHAPAPHAPDPHAPPPHAPVPHAPAPHVTTSHAPTPHATPPHATTPHAPAPHATPPHAPAPHATPPHAPAPHAPAPHAPAPHAPTPPHATPPHATPPHATPPHATTPHAPTPPHATTPHAPDPHATPPHAPAPHAPTPPHATPPHAAPPHAPVPHAPAPHPPPRHAPAPHFMTPHASAPRAPAPSATAAAPILASNKPPAKLPQIPPRAARPPEGITHGAPSQVDPRHQSVSPHTTPTTSSQPCSKPSQAHPQERHPQTASAPRPRESSPVPPPKPPRPSSDALVSPPKHTSQTNQSQHIPSTLPKSAPVTHIVPTNHPALTNRPTPANHETAANHAAPATQQHRASSSVKAAAGIPSALQASTGSSAPSHNHADSYSSASQVATPGEPLRSDSTGSLSRTGAVNRRKTPVSSSVVAQNVAQGLHPSRSEPSPTLHTKPPNALSTDSEPNAPESQHAWETEGSDGSSPFELLGQLAGGQAPDGELPLEQEADNLVHCKLSHPSPWILVL